MRLPVHLVFAAAIFFFAAPSPAMASTPGLLFVLTEKTATGAGDPATAYWWQGTGEPRWTDTDRALIDALDESAVSMVQPRDLSRMSKIYRRPGLTPSNALALASVFGASRAVLGTVTVTRLAPTIMGLTGYRVQVDASLVRPGKEGPIVVAELPVGRSAFASTPEEAAARARQEAMRSLADLLRMSLRRKVGPVGIATREPLIAVHGAEEYRHLQAVKEYLREIPGISDVRERWMAEGVVVLEVNPGVEDPPETIRQYGRSLQDRAFEDFRLERVEGTLTDVIQFRLLATHGG